MPRTILLIGGLMTECDRARFLKELANRTADQDICWDWAKAELQNGFQPAKHSLLNTLFFGHVDDTITPVLLPCLDKNVKKKILQKCPDPVLAPKSVETEHDLADWLLGAESGLIPRIDWPAEARLAAFFCMIAKLLKNKSWAKDIHGHHWTQEDDLLGQAPVSIKPDIRVEAGQLLDKMKDTLLLTKGGSQTKKEWAILRTHLAAVMNAFLDQSINRLKVIPALAPLISHIQGGVGETYRLDTLIAVERVRYVCRSNRPQT